MPPPYFLEGFRCCVGQLRQWVLVPGRQARNHTEHSGRTDGWAAAPQHRGHAVNAAEGDRVVRAPPRRAADVPRLVAVALHRPLRLGQGWVHHPLREDPLLVGILS